MDAAGEHTLQQVHRRVGRVGVRGVSLGDLQLRAAALLRDDARGGGQIHQGGRRAALPGQHASVDLRPDEALLEQAAVRSADFPHDLSDPRRYQTRPGGGVQVGQRPTTHSRVNVTITVRIDISLFHTETHSVKFVPFERRKKTYVCFIIFLENVYKN